MKKFESTSIGGKIRRVVKCAVQWTLYPCVDFSIRMFNPPPVRERKSLLIVRTDAIGDFIIFSPMLKYFRQLYPDYRITLVVNQLVADLAGRFDEVDEVIPLEIKPFGRDMRYRWNFLRKIYSGGFDVAIFPAGSRSAHGDHIVRFSGARERIGFDGDVCNIPPSRKIRNDREYTKLVPLPRDIHSELSKNKWLMENLGARDVDPLPRLEPARADFVKAGELLSESGMEGRPFVVFCPGAGDVYRCWQLEKYAEVIKWVRSEFNFETVLVGSPGELAMAEALSGLAGPGVVNIAGKTDLVTLAAVLSLGTLYVGSETGTLHLAAAVGTPTVCIMGGGHWGRFFPYGNPEKNRIASKEMPCFGCDWNCRYESVRCIEEIPVKDVLREIRFVLDEGKHESAGCF